MRIPILFAPLILAACSGAPETDVANSMTGSTPSQSKTARAASQTDSGVAPRPGQLRTFTDWTVGCDNIATCKAVSLMPEDATEESLLMSVERDAGPDGAVTIRFQTSNPIALPLTAIVDGQPVVRGGDAVDGFAVVQGEPANVLAAAVARGREASVTDAAGRSLGRISLTGASAALRWIDAQQGRAGTRGAIVARGDRADTRRAPASPTVRAVAPVGEAALLDPVLVTAMRKTAQCDTGDLPAVDAKPLGGGNTLALVPCRMGAYNLVQSVFIVRSGKAVAASFDAPSGIEEDAQPVHNVVNGSFEDGVLTSYAKGRGIGDCGIDQQFAWDGDRFRLIGQREMEECRGSIDFIRTWNARVSRR